MVHTEQNENDFFNADDILDTFMGNRETARDILTLFLERTGDQIRTFPEIAARQDWESARRNAHTIKGSSLTLSGRELGRLAARLELAYKDRNQAEIESVLPLLEEAFCRFREKAEIWLRSDTGEQPG